MSQSFLCFQSNLLDAIQFVISDKYSSLRSEERQKLLYEGAGRDILSASVELLFDNSDSRFPIDSSLVSLKRTIGMKKDEYFLDHKHMSRPDVMNLLEAAGLSRSNPYYVVQQGKISQLIKMKEPQRLELLKEIAGTRTYDERRKESVKIMKETDHRLDLIHQVIGFLDERLNELESEREELKEYQQYDSERRAIEYTIYEKEMKNINEKLAEIEKKKSTTKDDTSELDAIVDKANKNRQETESILKNLQIQDKILMNEKKKYAQERKQKLKELADAEIEFKEMREKVGSNAERKKAAEIELKSVEKEIEKANKSLEEINQQYERQVAEEQKMQQELNQTQQRAQDLYAKQSNQLTDNTG